VDHSKGTMPELHCICGVLDTGHRACARIGPALPIPHTVSTTTQVTKRPRGTHKVCAEVCTTAGDKGPDGRIPHTPGPPGRSSCAPLRPLSSCAPLRPLSSCAPLRPRSTLRSGDGAQLHCSAGSMPSSAGGRRRNGPIAPSGPVAMAAGGSCPPVHAGPLGPAARGPTARGWIGRRRRCTHGRGCAGTWVAPGAVVSRPAGPSLVEQHQAQGSPLRGIRQASHMCRGGHSSMH
jgi:hypothetical protein